jgi:hypothetical protein
MFAVCMLSIFAWPEFFGLMSVSTLGLSDTLFVVVLSLASPTIIAVLYKIMDKIKI